METRSMLAQAMELPKRKLTGTERLSEMERWDSMAMLNFMALVDAHYGVTLSPDHLVQCESVAEVEALVEETRNGNHAGVHSVD